MTSKEIKETLLIPNQLRFDEDNTELGVQAVLGRRLIQAIKPHTKIDELEKEGLLYAPERDKEKLTPPPSTGIVLMLGTSLNTDIWADEASLLKPGTLILFNKFALSSIRVGGQDLGIIDLADVMAVLEVTKKGEET